MSGNGRDGGTTSGNVTLQTHDAARSVAEWTTLAISSVLLLAIVTAIGWLTLSGDERPPTIVVEPRLDQVRQADGLYYVPVVIRNRGDLTAADVVIRGELAMPGQEAESAEISIAFLPGGKEVHGTLVYTRDPATGELTTRVASFEEP